MIGKHLPAGTKIECIYEARSANMIGFKGLLICAGGVYTLDGYSPHGPFDSVYIAEEPRVNANGLRYQYPRAFFKVVQSPKLPTEILECLNVKAPELV
jgi:hypothetical protein